MTKKIRTASFGVCHIVLISSCGGGMKINVQGYLNIKGVFLKPSYETCKKPKRSTRGKTSSDKTVCEGARMSELVFKKRLQNSLYKYVQRAKDNHA